MSPKESNTFLELSADNKGSGLLSAASRIPAGRLRNSIPQNPSHLPAISNVVADMCRRFCPPDYSSQNMNLSTHLCIESR